MSLKNKLLLLILAPIAVLCVVNILCVERVADRFEVAMREHREQDATAVARSIEGLIERQCNAAVNLSKPQEIRNAVQAADNEVLYGWSESFTNGVDSVSFADTQGLVLSRAPDEFRFGDNVSNTNWFGAALETGTFCGTARVDGFESMVCARRVSKYDDVPIGVVCVATRITPELLGRFVPNHTVILKYTGDQVVRSGSAGDTIAMSTPLVIPRKGFRGAGFFSLEYLPDQYQRQLVGLKRNVVVSGVVAASVTLLALVILLSRQIGPYSTVVDHVLGYARDAMSLNELRERLVRLRARPSREFGRIVDALIRMVDVITGNFKRIEEYNDRLTVLANTDTLTGLQNRKRMDEILESEIQRAERYGSPLAVLLADIDHFKRINDRHGHQIGDQVLTVTAFVLNSGSRSVDQVGRWGGEEFLIVAPGIDGEGAAAFAEKLRVAVSKASFPCGESVTISVGATLLKPDDSAHSLVGRADSALYEAKNAGRNAVRLALHS